MSASLQTENAPSMARIWDPFVRIFHWSLVFSFVVAWLTTHSIEWLHDLAGYAVAVLIVLRIAWGAFGTPYARFSQFVRHPATVVDYLRAILKRREPRYLGHNPAGGAMIVVLLIMLSATAFTGWMTTTNTYFGVRWVQELHEFFAHGVLVLVGIHLGGVVLASLRHRENLVVAMITGFKRRAGANDYA
jgi:cytochrome b